MIYFNSNVIPFTVLTPCSCFEFSFHCTVGAYSPYYFLYSYWVPMMQMKVHKYGMSIFHSISSTVRFKNWSKIKRKIFNFLILSCCFFSVIHPWKSLLQLWWWQIFFSDSRWNPKVYLLVSTHLPGNRHASQNQHHLDDKVNHVYLLWINSVVYINLDSV